MSMRPCEKCLENNWKYEFIDGWIRATCKMCLHEVEFESRRAKKIRQGVRIGKVGTAIVWEIKNGRMYHEGIEHDVFINKKEYLKIMRVDNNKKHWTRFSKQSRDASGDY